MTFKHLEYAKQSYIEHFKDSIKYVKFSLQAVFYFTVHSIYPDLFEHQGSDVIKKLNDILQEKINKIQKLNDTITQV